MGAYLNKSGRVLHALARPLGLTSPLASSWPPSVSPWWVGGATAERGGGGQPTSTTMDVRVRATMAPVSFSGPARGAGLSAPSCPPPPRARAKMQISDLVVRGTKGL